MYKFSFGVSTSLLLTAACLKTCVYCQLWSKISFLKLGLGQKLGFPEPVRLNDTQLFQIIAL
jgi:wyosine [tRNA(Phe)-imidazoG37] synthetase (radical SAM superfamily)